MRKGNGRWAGGVWRGEDAGHSSGRKIAPEQEAGTSPRFED